MFIQTLGGALLQGMLLTQLLEKALFPGKSHVGQRGDGASPESQPPEGRAQQKVMSLQDAPCGPLRKVGMGLGVNALGFTERDGYLYLSARMFTGCPNS